MGQAKGNGKPRLLPSKPMLKTQQQLLLLLLQGGGSAGRSKKKI